MIKRALILSSLAAALAVPVLADGDPANGEKVFKKCKACHAVGEGAKNKVGPPLNGIIGAPAGQVEGFKYSDAMIEARDGGLVWTDETLAAFLAKPKDVVGKTKMSFPGLKKETDQADVIAYLKGF
ncbi:MAG: c-type cytochrome [Ruegeria sp.]